MPHQQPSTTRRRPLANNSNRRATPGAARSAGGTLPARSRSGTVERDDTYGLISVVYHALQGAETCAQYVEDARRANNHALATFFEEARAAQNELALKGKHLLAAQLEETDFDEDDDILDDLDDDEET